MDIEVRISRNKDGNKITYNSDFSYYVNGKFVGRLFYDPYACTFTIFWILNPQGKLEGFKSQTEADKILREKITELYKENKDDKESIFWMCFVVDGNSPKKQHYSYSKAIEEAKRLTKQTGNNVYVLKSTSFVKQQEPIIIEF